MSLSVLASAREMSDRQSTKRRWFCLSRCRRSDSGIATRSQSSCSGGADSLITLGDRGYGSFDVYRM